MILMMMMMVTATTAPWTRKSEGCCCYDGVCHGIGDDGLHALSSAIMILNGDGGNENEGRRRGGRQTCRP